MLTRIRKIIGATSGFAFGLVVAPIYSLFKSSIERNADVSDIAWLQWLTRRHPDNFIRSESILKSILLFTPRAIYNLFASPFIFAKKLMLLCSPISRPSKSSSPATILSSLSMTENRVPDFLWQSSIKVISETKEENILNLSAIQTNSVQIFIETIDEQNCEYKKKHALDVTPNESIASVMKKFMDSLGITSNSYKLRFEFAGKRLKLNDSLLKYNIQNGSTISQRYMGLGFTRKEVLSYLANNQSIIFNPLETEDNLIHKESKNPQFNFSADAVTLKHDSIEARNCLVVQLILRLGKTHLEFTGEIEYDSNFVCLVKNILKIKNVYLIHPNEIKEILPPLAKLYFSNNHASQLVKDIASTFLNLSDGEFNSTCCDFIMLQKSKKDLGNSSIINFKNEIPIINALNFMLENLKPEDRLYALLKNNSLLTLEKILNKVSNLSFVKILSQVVYLLPSNDEIDRLINRIHYMFNLRLLMVLASKDITLLEKFQIVQSASFILELCSTECRFRVLGLGLYINVLSLALDTKDEKIIGIITSLTLKTFKPTQVIQSNYNEFQLFNSVSVDVKGNILTYFNFKDKLIFSSCSKKAKDLLIKSDKEWKIIEAGKLILTQSYMTIATEAACNTLSFHHCEVGLRDEGLEYYNYIISCLRTKEGLIALGSEILSIDNVIILTHPYGGNALEKFLFTKNGPSALKLIQERNIDIRDIAHHSVLLDHLLSDAAFAAWKRGLFVSERLVDTTLKTKNTVQYTFEQINKIANGYLPEYYNYVFSPHGIEALEEGLIALEQVEKIKYFLDLLVTEPGLKALRENRINIQELENNIDREALKLILSNDTQMQVYSNR